MAGPHFGPFGNEKQLTTGWETLVDGLTTGRTVTVKASTTNNGDILIRNKDAVGTGFRLEAADPPLVIEINFDNSVLQARASVDGNTVTYMGSSNIV